MLDFANYKKTLNNRTFTEYYKKLKLLAKSVFKWNNLPNGMNEKWIEDFLFMEGKCMFFNHPTLGFMVAKCSEQGTLNEYEEPTQLRPVIVNCSTDLGDIGVYENGKDCVFIRNNDDCDPTSRSIKLYAYRLTEITRTIDININAQKTPVLILCNQKQKQTLINVYNQWDENKHVIFGDKDLDLNGVKVLKTDAPVVFDKLQIEKNHIWNECMTFLGINNANMDKRERLVDDEVQANNEQIEMFAQMMLKAREQACVEINKIFGTNISVEFRVPKTADMKLIEGGGNNG